MRKWNIKSEKPVCPMAAVRPWVWSRWHAGPSTAPPPVAAAAAALAASLKGSHCCSAAAAAAVGLPGGSLWCREFGKPRLTRRYPPYPEMAQNLPINNLHRPFLVPSTLTRNCPLFQKWCNFTAISIFDQNLPFLLKVVSKSAVALWCIHCQHWYSSFPHFSSFRKMRIPPSTKLSKT